jgi:hypothetical protein
LAQKINSNLVPLPGVSTVTGADCSTVQDTNSDLSAWTNGLKNIQCYDSLKVNAQSNRPLHPQSEEQSPGAGDLRREFPNRERGGRS